MRNAIVTMPALMLAVTMAHAEWKGANVVPGATYRENGMVWQNGIRRQVIDDCKRTYASQPAGPCERAEILIRSESTVLIQCRVALARDVNAKPVDIVVYPLEEIAATFTVGAALPDATGVSSSCRPLPAELPPAPEPGSCSIEVKLPGDPDNFYPPGAKRRIEQGVVIIDFDVRYDQKHVLNPLVVRSGGYSSLDNGALKLARTLEVSMVGCLAGRARRGIQFEIMGEPTHSSPPGQGIMPTDIIRVEAFRAVLTP